MSVGTGAVEVTGQVLLLGSHALAGVIRRAKPEAIVEPLPLPIRSRRDDHRRGRHILNQYQGGMCISGS